jgi:hypothetical protein
MVSGKFVSVFIAVINEMASNSKGAWFGPSKLALAANRFENRSLKLLNFFENSEDYKG